MVLLDFSQVNWTSYQPGLLEQDLLTLPLEAAVSLLITERAPIRDTPLWPFADERNIGIRNPTRHTTNFGAPMMAAMAVPVVLGLGATQADFPMWPHIRGWVHAHLLTEILTISAKKGFQRHRPFYDTEVENGTARRTDSQSFFSGHSSHAFAAATYGSCLLLRYAPNPVAGWTLSSLFMLGATWIGSARALDGQHHWSDVAVGAMVGTVVGGLVSQRVSALADERQQKLSVNVGLVPVDDGLALQLQGSFTLP